MIELKPRDYDSEEFDSCGNVTYAELKINNIRIPLCKECLDELTKEVDKFKQVVYCYECKYYKYNNNHFRASCLRNQNISEDKIGIVNTTEAYTTCINGERK